MSTNKTTNYGLHQWQPGDTFLRSEINENFAALDTAVATKAAQSDLTALQTAVAGKAEVVFGLYTGDNAATHHIELGRQPVAVYASDPRGIGSSGYIFAGLFGPNAPLDTVTASVDPTGFTVVGDVTRNSSRLNVSNTVYRYVAFF